MFWFDEGYLLFVLPAIIFAMWAQAKVRSAFNTYSRQLSSAGRPAYEVAASLLSDAGLGDVRIERQRGELTDHYDPRTRTLRLSDSTFSSPSVAAIAVAAHEVGHAVQHSVGYAPLAIRNGWSRWRVSPRRPRSALFIGLVFQSGSSWISASCSSWEPFCSKPLPCRSSSTHQACPRHAAGFRAEPG